MLRLGRRQGGRIVSNALAIVEKPDHVCYRYRVRAYEPALKRQGIDLEAFPLPRNSLLRLVQFARLPRYDSVIIQRKLLSRVELRLLKRAAGRLVFDFDDAVFHRDSYDSRGPFSHKRDSRFRATMELADTASKAGARADRIVVIPTCVATELYPNPGQPKPPREGIELVWIGSSSTLQGLEARRNLFDRLVNEIPGIKLRVICDRFPDLGALPIVEVPWNEATEAAEIAKGDVGISWIPDDPWSRGKCGLKILQYQAAGLPVLTNPVGVHPEMIQPGVNGWLPVTDDDWVEAVKQLATDPARRDEMGRNARQSVEARYSVAAWKETFAAALRGSPSRDDASSAPLALRRERGKQPYRQVGQDRDSPRMTDNHNGRIEVHG